MSGKVVFLCSHTLKTINMITVIIASYRYGHLAAHCIESLLSQTILPSRILFVDDGGLDCSHLPSLYPDIEYIFRQKNLGVVDNFHNMLSKVNTEYVLFIGADNWLRSDAIELLSNASTDIVTYDIVVTGELKEEILTRVPPASTPVVVSTSKLGPAPADVMVERPASFRQRLLNFFLNSPAMPTMSFDSSPPAKL